MKSAISILTAAIVIVSLGCDGKKLVTERTGSGAGPAADGEAQAVAGLDTQQDLAHCRTALAQLDNLPSVSSRPAWSAAESDAIKRLLQLTPSEMTEIGQGTFSQTDGAYLEDCMLVRAGIRSLRLEGRTPLEQATAAFDWICRLIYIDDRIPWPSPVGTTLHSSFGVSAARAYAVLAAWQQLGLDGAFVAPASLATTPSFKPPTRPGVQPAYAPIAVCGVRIDKDVYLFDAATGKAVGDGKTPLTLAKAKAGADSVPGYKADDIKSWQLFLAPPISALSKRMEWLQKLNPGNSGVKLFANVTAMQAAFKSAAGDVPVGGWNPPADQYTATRILSLYTTEGESTEGKRAHRDLHKQFLVPANFIPKTDLEGDPLVHVLNLFFAPFIGLTFDWNTPRNLLIRGQFSDATSALEDVKKRIDNAQTRFEQDASLKKDFQSWSNDFRTVVANYNRVRLSDPSSTGAATKVLDDFLRNPKNRDIETAFIWGSASRPLGAVVNHLMAQCVHERAERARTDVGQWKNAEEWWNRFLDSSSQAGILPAREAHAKAMLERCRQFTSK